MDYIIEVLGFRDSHNKFVLKEVAVVALRKEYIAHWIAAAPHSFCDLPIKIQVFNNWLTSNHHGIEWFDGNISHREVHANLRELTRPARQIFIKGSQESAIIQSITTRHVENLENYNCPPLHQLIKATFFVVFMVLNVHRHLCAC